MGAMVRRITRGKLNDGLTKVSVRWCVGVAVALVLIGAGPAASAAPSSNTQVTAHAGAKQALRRGPADRVSYYLALGDSVPVWDGNQSYPNLILAHYQRELPGLTLENLAVSGETTTSMLQGQYPEALSFLQAHRGHVGLITIDIGGNDIVGCAFLNDPACNANALATIKQNLTTMLAGLHAAAPRVPVIGMNYYDPLLGDWLAPGLPRSNALATVPGLVALNQELTSLYGGAANTADVQDIFHATDFTTIVSSPWGEVPIAVDLACSWLDIYCQPGLPEGFGDDPNNAGAVAIATAFEQNIDQLCVRHVRGVFRRCRPR